MTSSIPYISLFASTLGLRTALTLSANQWIYIWMGLELNMLSFIPIITAFSNNRETEAAIKYFLAQAIGSGLLLLGAFNKYIILELARFSPLSNEFSSIIILMAILIKLGAAPCHFWFPAVISKLSWPLCIILSTWQKIAPLIILNRTNVLGHSRIIIFIRGTGRIVGGIGGLNQSQLRPLLAYSSVGHLGWIIASPSLTVTISYLIIYSITSVAIISILWILSTSHWSPKLSISMITPAYSCSLLILTLSLAGLPPFLGFLPKWIILNSLSTTGASIIWPIILILGSSIQLYYYINLILSFYIKTNNYTISKKIIESSWPQAITLLSTVLLGLSPIIFILCAMTLLNQPQRHWNSLFYFWHLSRAFRNIYKSSYPGRARATWLFTRERSTI